MHKQGVALKCDKCHLNFANRHEKSNHEARFCYSSQGRQHSDSLANKLTGKPQPSSYLDEVNKLFIEIDKRFAFFIEDQAKYSDIVWRRQNDKPPTSFDQKIKAKNASGFIKRIEAITDFLLKKSEMQARYEQDVSSLQSKIELLKDGDSFSAERRQIYQNLIEYRRRIQSAEIKLFEQIESLRVRYLKIKLLFYKSEKSQFEDDSELAQLLEACEKSKHDVFERKALYENALESLSKNTRFTVPDLKSFDQYYDNEILKNIMRLSLAKIKHLKSAQQSVEKELISGNEPPLNLPAKKHPFIYLAQRNILEERSLVSALSSCRFSKNKCEAVIGPDHVDFVHPDPSSDNEENPNDITYF